MRLTCRGIDGRGLEVDGEEEDEREEERDRVFEGVASVDIRTTKREVSQEGEGRRESQAVVHVGREEGEGSVGRFLWGRMRSG